MDAPTIIILEHLLSKLYIHIYIQYIYKHITNIYTYILVLYLHLFFREEHLLSALHVPGILR